MRHQNGSALVEVLVASAILGIGVLGLIMGQTRASMDLQRAQWRMEARFLAMDYAEQLRAYGQAGPSATQSDRWRERVGRRLPDGSATVTPGADVGTTRITLSWRNPGESLPAELRYAVRR
jgi:type IV pilus assembly protein PilV